MKRTKHTPVQIVRKQREADRLMAENIPLAEVMRHLEIAQDTYQRWHSQYGAIRLNDATPLKMFEQENACFKRFFVEEGLDDDMLRMAADLLIKQISQNTAYFPFWPSL